ncbi:MFS transporter [Streptomyces sp. MS1.AVA.3]|uniref:MFS transporter n=1 Tax=Streptomyces decoyicus TaxID=249567 RepID=UPI0030BBB356
MPTSIDVMGGVRSCLMRAADAGATSVATYGIPLLILTTTGSTALTGLMFLLEWLPRLMAFTIGGPLVDRYGAGRIFRTVTTMRTLLMALAAIALLTVPTTSPVATSIVMVVGAAGGLLGQASFVAVETIGGHISHQAGDQAHRVQAVQVTVDQGALLVGPLLGGLLLLAGPSALLIGVAGMSLAASVSTSATDIMGPPSTSRPAWGEVLTSVRSGWRTVRGIPALGWLVTGLVASNLAVAVAQASSPITVLHHYGRSALAAGTVWSAAGVVSLGAVAVCRTAIPRWGLWPVGTLAAAAACIACTVAAIVSSFAAYAAAIGLLMAGEGALTVVLRTLRTRLIPAQVFGATLSVTILLVVIPIPLAGLLVAALPATSVSALLLACSGLQAVVMTAALHGLWRHRASYSLPPATAADELMPATSTRPHSTA